MADRTFTTFAGTRRVISADLRQTVLRTREVVAGGETQPVIVFDDESGKQVDFDLRGDPDEVLARLASHPVAASLLPAQRSGPGRPRLGVVSREVSLLARHWDWLEHQASGASAALRRLVSDAMKCEPPAERARHAREAAGRFMWTMAGNLPEFEEASRALFARDEPRLSKLTSDWPEDIRAHLTHLLEKATSIERGAAEA